MENHKLNRRDFLRLSTTVAAGVILAACQPATPQAVEEVVKESAAAEEKVPAKAAEQVLVKYMDWGGARYPKAWEEVGPGFEADNPGIKVEYQPVPDQAQEKVMAMFVAKSPSSPDIYAQCCDRAKLFWEAGAFMDLMPYWDNVPDSDKNDFPQNATDFWTMDGALVSVPKYQGNMIVFVNMDMAEEAGITSLPKTWDDAWSPEEYREILQKLSKGELGKPGRVFGGSRMVYANNGDRDHPFFASNGGNAINPDDDTEMWIGRPEALEVIDFWRVVRAEDHTMPLPEDVAGDMRMRNNFPAKLVASMEEGVWALSEAALNSPFRWDIAPQYSWPKQKTTLATTDGFGVWKETPNPDAVWEVLVFLMSPTYAKAIAKADGLQPGRLSLMDDWAKIMRDTQPKFENVNLELFKEARERELGVVMELAYDQTTYNELMKPAYEDVLLLGKGGVEIIAEAADKITEKLKEIKAKREG